LHGQMKHTTSPNDSVWCMEKSQAPCTVKILTAAPNDYSCQNFPILSILFNLFPVSCSYQSIRIYIYIPIVLSHVYLHELMFEDIFSFLP